MADTKKRGLDEFRAAHDKSFIVPQKIRAGLASLGDSWEYEMEFIRRCGLSTGDFAIYREPFAKHSIDVPASSGKATKRVWAGTISFATKLRAKLTA